MTHIRVRTSLHRLWARVCHSVAQCGPVGYSTQCVLHTHFTHTVTNKKKLNNRCGEFIWQSAISHATSCYRASEPATKIRSRSPSLDHHVVERERERERKSSKISCSSNSASEIRVWLTNKSSSNHFTLSKESAVHQQIRRIRPISSIQQIVRALN